MPIDIAIGEEGESFWQISIADCGIGLSKEQNASIFDRYTSRKKGFGSRNVYLARTRLS
ncbi:MAG: hypothetical protein ACREBS_07340 [Nitrososphaerales archaeon]